jgi:exodeoxyribonuclease-3
LLKGGGPVILAGDHKVIPNDMDADKPERWVDDAPFFPESFEACRQLAGQGWTDALRAKST